MSHSKQNKILKSDAWGEVQFSSVTQLCPTLCNPMNRSMPGLPVHHIRQFTEISEQNEAQRLHDKNKSTKYSTSRRTAQLYHGIILRGTRDVEVWVAEMLPKLPPSEKGSQSQFQHDSDMIYLEIESNYTGKVLSPIRPPSTSDASHVSRLLPVFLT